MTPNHLIISAFLFFVAALLSAQEYGREWLFFWLGLETWHKPLFWFLCYHGFSVVTIILLLAWFFDV